MGFFSIFARAAGAPAASSAAGPTKMAHFWGGTQIFVPPRGARRPAVPARVKFFQLFFLFWPEIPLPGGQARLTRLGPGLSAEKKEEVLVEKKVFQFVRRLRVLKPRTN